MATEPLPQEQPTQASPTDSHIGKAAVEAKLATPDEIQSCITKWEKLRAQGKAYRLSEVLIKSGVVTASQLKRLANPAEDSAAQSFHQIPGFRVMQKIGAGAMASVYKAKQLSLDRIVAIKILPKRLSEDKEFVERFYKEGKAAAKMNHNNIVQAIDVGEFAGYHYFVMEYVDGETVYDELIRNRVYTEQAALNIIIQIAKALEHAHARGLIHRDVKPKNIMITRDGTAKLADMGLARLADDVAAAEAEKGRAFGTPYYISPEQIRGVMDVDFRADIYSLGGTLYHMITGRVPFDGQTPTQIMQKHLKEPLVPPDHINKSLSTGLAEVVEKMMAKDRNQRYQSTGDLLMDLSRIQQGMPPLQARASVASAVLENLADGSQQEFFEHDSAQRAARDDAAATPYPVWLVAMAVMEAVIIALLLVIVAVK